MTYRGCDSFWCILPSQEVLGRDNGVAGWAVFTDQVIRCSTSFLTSELGQSSRWRLPPDNKLKTLGNTRWFQRRSPPSTTQSWRFHEGATRLSLVSPSQATPLSTAVGGRADKLTVILRLSLISKWMSGSACRRGPSLWLFVSGTPYLHLNIFCLSLFLLCTNVSHVLRYSHNTELFTQCSAIYTMLRCSRDATLLVTWPVARTFQTSSRRSFATAASKLESLMTSSSNSRRSETSECSFLLLVLDHSPCP